MQFHEMELAVGDVLQIGEKILTVVDIDQGEVTFRLDDGEIHDDLHVNGNSDCPPIPR